MNRKEAQRVVTERRVLRLTDGKDYGVCPPPMDAKTALHELAEHLLGDDWYIPMPVSGDQANTEIVLAIEQRYPSQRRKR